MLSMFGIFSKKNKIKKLILTHQIEYNSLEKEIHNISSTEYFVSGSLDEEMIRARFDVLKAKQKKLIAVIDLLRYEVKDDIIKDFDDMWVLDKFPESRGYVYESNMFQIDIKPFCDEFLFMDEIQEDTIQNKKDEIQTSDLIEPIKNALLYKQINKQRRLAIASSRIFQAYDINCYIAYNNLRKYKDCSCIILCLSDIDYIRIADTIEYFAKRHKVNIILFNQNKHNKIGGVYKY